MPKLKKLRQTTNGYPLEGVDGAIDFLWFVDHHGVDIADALVILREVSKRNHEIAGKDRLTMLKAQKRECAKGGKDHKGVPPKPKEDRQQPPLTVIGICECGGRIMGEPLQSCETKRSGRVFYKECSSCSYYAEVVKKGNKFTELEGG